MRKLCSNYGIIEVAGRWGHEESKSEEQMFGGFDN